MADELAELKKAKKNIGSIITTNYDQFLEQFLEFTPLIGNDILLSNPYGSVYKIHGCISKPDRIIITKSDYEQFNKKYELIRAQLLSIFIHNPIIFLGYGIGDENIKHLLKIIFNYVQPNTSEAEKIRSNFLLVEYDHNSTSQEICEHYIDIEGFQPIRINKIKTNDFQSIYQSIANLTLPISAMDIRKVQNIIKDIYSGEGGIKVTITEDLDALRNGEKILAIGSSKSIQYNYFTIQEMVSNYFNIIEESNVQILLLLNKQKVQTSQYFPSFGFSRICGEISDINRLKNQQENKLNSEYENIDQKIKTGHSTIKEIIDDISIATTYKTKSILWSIMSRTVSLEDAKQFLKNYELKSDTDYKKLLCAYDFIKYSE